MVMYHIQSHTPVPGDVYFECVLLLKVNRRWHFLHSPSSHWTGWSLTSFISAAWSQAGRQASLYRLLLNPTTPAQRTSLFTSSPPLISRGQLRALPRLSLKPKSCFELTGCGRPARVDQKWRIEGGMCAWVQLFFFFFKPANHLWCYDCMQLNRLMGGNIQLKFCISNESSDFALQSFNSAMYF